MSPSHRLSGILLGGSAIVALGSLAIPQWALGYCDHCPTPRYYSPSPSQVFFVVVAAVFWGIVALDLFFSVPTARRAVTSALLVGLCAVLLRYGLWAFSFPYAPRAAIGETITFGATFFAFLSLIPLAFRKRKNRNTRHEGDTE